MTVYGTVPEGWDSPLLIVAAATTGGGVWVNATTPVTVTRPALTSTANVSAAIDGDRATNSGPTVQTVTSSERSAPLTVPAPFGRTVRVTVRIEAGAGGIAAMCSSLALTVSTAPPGKSAGDSALPSCVTVASTSSSSLVLRASPTAALPPRGTTAVLCVGERRAAEPRLQRDVRSA